MENLALFIFLALIAEILGTVGGFGSSLFFVPIAGYFLDFHSVLGITAVFHLTSNVSKIAMFRNGIDKKLLINLGIPSVILVIIGALLSSYFSSDKLELSLGIFLIILSVFFLVKKDFELKPTNANAIAGGSISGFLAGLIGTGGAVRGLTLTSFRLPMAVFIATSAFIDLFIDASRSVVYFFNGYIHQHDLYLIPILFVVSIVGTYIGKVILRSVSEDRFRIIVLVLIFITGIITIYKFFMYE